MGAESTHERVTASNWSLPTHNKKRKKKGKADLGSVEWYGNPPARESKLSG